MNCSDVRRYLSAYLDSELDCNTNLAVNDHLERCGDCAERFEQEAGLESAIRDHLAATPSRPEFWSGVDAALKADDRRRGRRWWPAAFAAAALALITAGLWSAWPPATSAGTGAGTGEIGLIVALRERATDVQREGTTVVNGYRALDAASAKALVERFLGNAAFLEVAPRPTDVAPHKLQLVGGGTTHVGGEETPVLHYRCCNKDLCVFFMVPASLQRFPKALEMLKQRGDLTCRISPTGTVSIHRCPKSGAVIGVAGSPCAPSLPTVLVSR
jgi:anti-sigma factor RsiW